MRGHYNVHHSVSYVLTEAISKSESSWPHVAVTSLNCEKHVVHSAFLRGRLLGVKRMLRQLVDLITRSLSPGSRMLTLNSDATHHTSAVCWALCSSSIDFSIQECEGTSTGNRTFFVRTFFSEAKEETRGDHWWHKQHGSYFSSFTRGVGNVSAVDQQGRS